MDLVKKLGIGLAGLAGFIALEGCRLESLFGPDSQSVLASPTNLTAVLSPLGLCQDCYSVSLDWDYHFLPNQFDDRELGFKIYRFNEAAEMDTIIYTGDSETEYVDNLGSQIPGEHYTYRVSAIDGPVIESYWSDPAEIIIE